MTIEEISYYLSKEIVVKSTNSKTKINYIDGKTIVGYFLNAAQKNIEQSKKTNIWTFYAENETQIEFNGDEVKSLQVL